MKILAWFDKIPLRMIAVPAVLLALAPFAPESHLWEKLKMLVNGALVRQIDIFDLCLHGSPLILLAIKLLRGERG